MSITPGSIVYTDFVSGGPSTQSTTTITIRMTSDNKFSCDAFVDVTPLTNQDVLFTGPSSGTTASTIQLFIDGTLTETVSFDTGFVNNNGTLLQTRTFATPTTNATSSVRLVISIQGATWFDNPPQVLDLLLRFNRDLTFQVKKPTSITRSLLTLNPLAGATTGPDLVFLPSTITPNLLHIKNIGAGSATLRILTRTIDASTNTLQLPARAGISLLQDGSSNWFIATYYGGGALTTGTATGGTAPTRSVVLANITSGDKTVALPDPTTLGQLMICGYTTGTTAVTTRLVIVTNGHSRETGSSSYSFQSQSGVAVGVFLVSDGSKWNILGLFRGTNVTYDAGTGTGTSVTSPLCLGNTGVDTMTPGVVPGTDEAAFHIFKTRTITWANGYVIGNSPNRAVNANFRRFFRNNDVEFSACLFVNAVLGAGGVRTVFPIAQYPAEL